MTASKRVASERWRVEGERWRVEGEGWRVKSISRTQHDEADGQQPALQAAVVATVQPVFALGNHLAKEHDGVGEPGGIAQQQVEQPACQQCQ